MKTRERERERGKFWLFARTDHVTMSSQAMGDGQIRLVRSLIVIGSVLRIVKREERRERDNNEKKKKKKKEERGKRDAGAIRLAKKGVSLASVIS